MTTLSSLLVSRKAATIADMDEALARQVVDGGDLATCLLELSAIVENALPPLLAESFGIESAGAGELPPASPRAIGLIPRALALRYGIFPVDERDGELSVVVSEPLPHTVETELGFALGTRLCQRVAPLVRIHQAIAREYGGPLDPRFAKLLTKLDGRAPVWNAAGSGERRTQTLPAASSMGRMGAGTAESKLQAIALSSASSTSSWVARSALGRGPGSPRQHTLPGLASPAGEGPFVAASAAPSASSSLPAIAPRSDVAPERESASGVEKQPPPQFVIEAMIATAAQVEKKRHRKAARPSGQALLGWARRAVGNVVPSDRPASRRRGPLTPADAERELEEVQAGDEVLGIFFAFARQYFEYAALFVVHGDLAEGHESWGPGAGRDKVRGIGVALDLPSALSEARASATPVIATLGSDGLDAGLREDLLRSAPADVLILPIVVVKRCVALLYGDDGEHPVELGGVGEVLAMVPLVERALERILRRKKRSARKNAAGVESRGGAGDSNSIAPSVGPSDPVHSASSGSSTTGPAHAVELVDGGWAEAPAARDNLDDAPEITYSEAMLDPALLSMLDAIDESQDVSFDSPVPAEPAGVKAAAVIATAPRAARRLLESGPASERFSVEPHAVPVSRAPRPPLPTVLIRSELVDQVVAGGEEGERALGEILALGEAAIPSVFARFPGPLVVDRTQIREDLPRPADCGPVLRVVAAMRRLALPFLAVRSGDADVEVRFWATYLLGELHYPDTAAALLPRLFDENTAVRRIAIRSARTLVAGNDEAVIPLRKNLERMVAYPDEPEGRRLVAIGVLSELHLYRSIPALIAALSDHSPMVSGAAVSALVTMTRQEFGRDPRKWGEWWETRGKKRLR
jgi:hypothetical protein